MPILLSTLPIVALLLCLLVFKLPVPKAAGISLLVALGLALGVFGLPIAYLPFTIGKALWLALFVSLIVWFAIFLYHLVGDFKAMEVISKNLSIFVEDKFVSFLLLAWMFTGLLQGMAGFGVPAVIVTPILIALGHNKIKSLAGALLGHSWAVTFGSLGAAYFVILGITEVDPTQLAHAMWIFNTAAHLLTGLGVCFIYDGFKGIKKGFSYVLPVSVVMTVVQYVTILFGAYPVAGLLPALVGVLTMFLLYKIRSGSKEKKTLFKNKLNLLQSALPYIVIIILALSFQFFIPQSVNDAASFGPNFPAGTTESHVFSDFTHEIDPITNYNAIRLFRHPAFLLLSAAVTAMIVYKAAGIWNKDTFKGVIQNTVKKGKPATLALVGLGSMSLVMMDAGMTVTLAQGVADLSGRSYPLFAPLIAVLSSFLTGNNTNANVLFGYFQFTTANIIGVNYVIMTALQSMMAGVAVSIGPTLILMGALASDQPGPETVSAILKKLMPIVILIAIIMGVINFFVIQQDVFYLWGHANR